MDWTSALLSALTGGMQGYMAGKEMKETKRLEQEERERQEKERERLQKMLEDINNRQSNDPMAAVQGMTQDQQRAVLAHLLGSSGYTLFPGN